MVAFLTYSLDQKQVKICHHSKSFLKAMGLEVIKKIAAASSMQIYFSTINNAKISLYISAK